MSVVWRFLQVLTLYVCFLGIVSIAVTWSDGARVSLVGWPEALENWWKRRSCP